jgi:ABC-type tungstate transport system substrate-binding protein
MFLIMLIPPIIVLISGFKWMGLIGYNSEIIIYAIWILGHTILTLPILGSFVLSNHFRVSNNELDYLKVFKLNNSELIRLSFLKRFKAEYLLLFIIGYSFIWNEAILNNLFSDYIPSFTSGLKMLITGRAADYSSAFGYLLVSIILAVTAVLIWRYIIEKAHKLANES